MKKLLLIFVLFSPSFITSQMQDTVKTEDIQWYYSNEIEEFDQTTYSPPVYMSPGDRIQKSSWLRLSAFTIGIGISTLFAAGAFKDLESEQQTGIAIAAGEISLGLYIADEITLIKQVNR